MANAAVTATTWVGTTDDATLGSNWTFGVPDNASGLATLDMFIEASPSTSLVGFGAVRARGTLTGTGNFIADEVVVLDSKTYTYKASPSADGEVDLGVDLETSLDNLFDSINLVAGGAYGASMTIHPTVTAISNSATVLVVVAKDAGTGGNSIVSTTDGANASWGAGTLGDGAANGDVLNNIWSDEDWAGDINSSGTKAQIAFNKLFHRGSGTIYIDVLGANRLIIEGTNLVLAAEIILTSGLVSLEVVSGTATLDQNAVADAAQRVVLTEATSTPSKLTITGTGTIGEVRRAGGFLDCNGPVISDMIASGTGRTRFRGGTLTALVNASKFEFEVETTLVSVEHLAGIFDMTTTAAPKTVTEMFQYPAATLTYRTDFDTITALRRIGVD